MDPDLAYEAAEESRRQAGENVIVAIGAKIDSQSARIDVKFSQIESQITEVRAEIKAQNSRIDDLEPELIGDLSGRGLVRQLDT